MPTVAVTGGAKGIGRAIALHFARHGYAVSIADTNAAAGHETLASLTESGAKAVFVATDVADAKAVDRWLTRTVDELDAPDVLVNNAGFFRGTPFLDLSPADFDRVIAVNLRGTFLCAQAAARRMVSARRGGSIVNIASTRAFMSEPGTESYSASKGGIVALTHAMAISLGPMGIRVNCICPGWIETRSTHPPHSERDRSQHPVGRVGRPEDIAEACLFLAQGAGFMTGQTVTIDGGMTVKMIYEE